MKTVPESAGMACVSKNTGDISSVQEGEFERVNCSQYANERYLYKNHVNLSPSGLCFLVKCRLLRIAPDC